MAKYRFIIEADSAKDRDALKKFLAGAEQPFTLEKVKKKKEPKSRANRLAKVELFAEEAKSIVEELYDEMEQWRDSILENLQSGGKYSEVEECCDALETIKSAFEEMDFNGVSFYDRWLIWADNSTGPVRVPMFPNGVLGKNPKDCKELEWPIL